MDLVQLLGKHVRRYRKEKGMIQMPHGTSVDLAMETASNRTAKRHQALRAFPRKPNISKLKVVVPLT